MIDLAKTLGNDAEMIRLTQIFVQQPRNTVCPMVVCISPYLRYSYHIQPNSIAVPYCQKAPKNSELRGLFQCQFQGANQRTFIGGATLGAPGTIPFGLTELNPLGSCPAHPQGPIADGTQLVDQVQSPGTGAPGGGTGGGQPPATTTSAPPQQTTSTSAVPPAQTTSTGGNGGFLLANGQEAQKLNAKFANLSKDSPCSAGEIACVDDAFAQCVEGQFVTISCGATNICAALPLVNSRGTSVTCTSRQDAEDRIARTGATGGLTGNGGAGGEPEENPEEDAEDDEDAPEPTPAPSSTSSSATPAATTPAGGAGGFKLANGQAAQALNKKFEGLTPDSPCSGTLSVLFAIIRS